MYKMHSDCISPTFLPVISHQSFSYEWHSLSIEPGKAVNGVKGFYLYLFCQGKESYASKLYRFHVLLVLQLSYSTCQINVSYK